MKQIISTEIFPVLLVMIFFPFLAYSSDYYLFDGNSPLPSKLISDPNEFQNISSFQNEHIGKFAGETFFEIGFSNEASVLSIKNSEKMDIANFGVLGGIVSKFDFNSRSFDLFCADFKGGIFAVYLAPWKENNKFTLLLYHNSSHLGDDFVVDYGGKPINSSYEILKFFHYLNIIQNLELTYGIHYILRKDKTVQSPGRAAVQLNAEYGFPVINRKIYFSIDFQSSGMYNWAPSYSAMAGFQISEIRANNPAQSIAIGYYAGHSHFGQFYEEKSNLLYLAIIVDF